MEMKAISTLRATRRVELRYPGLWMFAIECSAFDPATPRIGIVYNGIAGAYLLSAEKEEITQDHYDKLKEFSGIKDDELAILNNELDALGIPRRSGRAIISSLLPKTLNYGRESGDPADVVIRNGIMRSGILTAKDVANKAGGIIAAIGRYDRWIAPWRFIDCGYKVFSNYLTYKGITLSLSDYSYPIVNLTRNIESINTRVKELENIKQMSTGGFVDSIELSIILLISEFINSNSKIIKKKQNSDLNILSFLSGARGTLENISSASVAVGQMYHGGERLKSSTRLTPYDDIGETSIFANGFIQSNYKDGLSPKRSRTAGRPGSNIRFHNIYENAREWLCFEDIVSDSTLAYHRRILQRDQQYGQDYRAPILLLFRPILHSTHKNINRRHRIAHIVPEFA